MTDNERDTKFAGFAQLLTEEVEGALEGIAEFTFVPDMISNDIKKIIAQRAYDLASFAVYKSMRGCSLAQIPDITEWATLTDNRKFDV